MNEVGFLFIITYIKVYYKKFKNATASALNRANAYYSNIFQKNHPI
jgi:hypothetical protein